MAISVKKSETALRILMGNGASISFALEDGMILGIRDVEHSGIPLRNPSKLWRPFFYTPEGIHYARFRLLGARREGGGIVVGAEAEGVRTLRRDEEDEYLCDVLDVGPEDETVLDRFAWVLRPSSLALDGESFSGFSYAYRFESRNRQRRIHRIFDSATWEIGGHVRGNTLLCQGQVNPPAVRLSMNRCFTTACNYYSSEMGPVLGRPKRVSMQRLSRMGTLQAFDFLHHASGVLFNYFDPTDDVVSLIHKDAGEDILHIMDEVRRPLSRRFSTFPKHVLFLRTAGSLAREGYRNLWWHALEFVHGRERARHGIRRSAVLPQVWTPQIRDDVYRIGRNAGPRKKTLYFLADHIVPRWADMGVKEICAPSYWVSDYTVDRYKCKNDTGLQGGLTVSGICCVRAHEIDPLWGGPRALAFLVRAVHRRGMRMILWWATHLSRRAPIFAQRPDFMIRSRDGQPGCGGIGHETVIPMDLNNPDCLEWEFAKLKRLYELTGIDGFFHDSYGNYTFLPVNYGDELRRTQQEAFARLLARLQGLGMDAFTAEGLGPWAVGHFGMGLIPSTPGRPVSYQNALDWWLADADMICGLNMGIGAPVWKGREEEARKFAFRCLAGGGRFGFTACRGGVEMWTGWLKEQNRMHARLGPVAGRRTLLERDRGVLWDLPDGRRLLFAFREFNFPADAGRTLTRVTGDGEIPVAARRGQLRARPWSAYRIV